MKTKKLTLFSIFLAVGFLLHQIMPGIPFLGGMKMDFLLVMFFFSIFYCENLKEVLTCSLLFGILSALTTTFPGGQAGNLIDKPVTGIFFFALSGLIGKKLPQGAKSLILPFLSTIISGFIFLRVSTLASGMSVPVMNLLLVLVIPTAVLNSLGYSVLTRYAVKGIFKTDAVRQ